MSHTKHDDDLLDLSLFRQRAEPVLCDQCKSFDIHSFATAPNHQRGYTYRSVEHGTEEGCPFCNLLLECVQDIVKPAYFQFGFLPGSFINTNPDVYVHMSITKNYNNAPPNQSSNQLDANRLQIKVGDRFSDIKHQSESELCLIAEKDSLAAKDSMISGRHLGFDPSSPAYFEAIKSWLTRCTEGNPNSHSKCRQTVSGDPLINSNEVPLPSRCIHVRKNGKKVSIEETEGKFKPYITLTHRWNKDTERSKTTMANYQNRCAGKEFENFPQLFNDVITIARKLDIEYIWIDSICIIQEGDDKADWRKEAPKMAGYYQNSKFTIVGAREDLSHGILSPLNQETAPWGSSLLRLPYRDRSGRHVDYFYVYKRPMTLLDEYDSMVRESKVFKRAWVLQEWLLSKRLIWYTNKGMFLECNSEPPVTPNQEQISMSMASSSLQDHFKLKANFTIGSPSILDFWYSAMAVYSAFDITFTSDRVLAVAGLAKEVSSVLAKCNSKPREKMIYISGLWLEDLHRGLLWETEPDAAQRIRTVEQAPSWSWVSLMTPVKWPLKSLQVKNEIKIESTVECFDPANMFSSLNIQGKLEAVHIHGYFSSEERTNVAAVGTAYEPAPTSGRWRAVCPRSGTRRIGGWASMEQAIPGETGCSDIGMAVLALMISTRAREPDTLLSRGEPIANVLFLTEDPETETYQRIGVGRIFDKEIIKGLQKAALTTIKLV